MTKRYIPLIATVTIVITSLLVSTLKGDSISNTNIQNTPVPTPTMEDISYSTEKLSNGRIRIISNNYYFQMDVPSDMTIKNGGGFSASFPEAEAALMQVTPGNKSKFNIIVTIPKTNDSSIPDNKPAKIGDKDGFIKITNTSIDGSSVYSYYVENQGRYIELSFSNWGGDISTSSAIMQEMQKVVASFKILN